VTTAAFERAVSPGVARSSRWWWERGILIGGLLIATLLAWRQLAHMHAQMHAGASFPLLLVLWSVMTIGMMLPAASPMIMTFAAINRRNGGSAILRTLLFTAAYLCVWSIASAGGALAQAGLGAISIREQAGAMASPVFLAGALLVAGIWQLTPVKHACLRRCRTPLGFLLTEWRSGARGALVMGARHGTDCLLCCWALMVVMLGLGTMNLAVMAVLTAIMVAEKIAPGGHHIGRASALVLLASGGWQLLRLT
jgi:predicted metal-binding membrane protein